MKDPSSYAFLTTLIIAVLVFAVGGMLRIKSSRKQEEVSEESPYAAPQEGNFPLPPMPEGKVITWPYSKFDLLGIVLLVGVFFSMAFHSATAPANDASRLSADMLVHSIIFQFGIAGMAMLTMAFRVRISQWLGLHWEKWPWVFLIAPAVVGVMWCFLLGLHLVGYEKWMEAMGVERMQDSVKLLQESKDPLVLGLMAFAAVLVAPVCEEIVFRGYLYGAVKKFTGGVVATIFSALVFAAAHGSLAALLPLFVVGLLLAIVYEKTGSIWAPMAVHLCFNGATVAVQFLVRVYGIEIQ